MKHYTLVSSLMFVLFACQQIPEKENSLVSKKEIESTLIRSHQAFLKIEKERIDNFVDSTGLDFGQSGTGLRYYIKSSAKGDSLRKGDLALITYTLMLLDGDTLYESPPGAMQEFAVDYDDVESGLHEGIKYMKVGDEATLILPAHLAHGITGDQAAIPPQSTLVYDIKLLAKR